eukprot:GHVP01000771.1.p1 GENE.GHVP01000771.1~~GHVP01000771.1.p1  ORF type:complete len:330 (+),score=47.64 GHVP01000771.1:62-991(+)
MTDKTDKTLAVVCIKGTGSTICKKPSKWTWSLLKDVRLMFSFNINKNLLLKKIENINDLISNKDKLRLNNIITISQHGSTYESSKHKLKIGKCKNNDGPTLIFNIEKYTLISDIKKINKFNNYNLNTNPLILLSNFDKINNTKINDDISYVLKNLYKKNESIKENNIQRVIMFHYLSDCMDSDGVGGDGISIDNYSVNNKADNKATDKEDKINNIELRHYWLVKRNIGVSRGIRKLFKKGIPDLSKYEDSKQYLEKMENDMTSASDGEGMFEFNNTKKGVRLIEIGPRLTLSIDGIKSGLFRKEFRRDR